MKLKELYELAQTLGAEDYEIEVWGKDEPISHRPERLDYVSHGDKVICITDIDEQDL